MSIPCIIRSGPFDIGEVAHFAALCGSDFLFLFEGWVMPDNHIANEFFSDFISSNQREEIKGFGA